ncbi:MAG: thioredoxin family protein [Gammaproteobacteria bacterium]
MQDRTIISRQTRFIRNLDDENFYAHMAASRGLSVVFFSSHGCSSCRRWQTILREFLVRYDDVHICAVDAQTSMALTRAYDIFHLPSLFLFVDGQYHRALQAHASVASLRDAIDAAAELHAEEEP